jgi:hypothetical protein
MVKKNRSKKTGGTKSKQKQTGGTKWKQKQTGGTKSNQTKWDLVSLEYLAQQLLHYHRPPPSNLWPKQIQQIKKFPKYPEENNPPSCVTVESCPTNALDQQRLVYPSSSSLPFTLNFYPIMSKAQPDQLPHSHNSVGDENKKGKNDLLTWGATKGWLKKHTHRTVSYCPPFPNMNPTNCGLPR